MAALLFHQTKFEKILVSFLIIFVSALHNLSDIIRKITHMHIQNNKSIIVILYNKNKEHTRVNENQNIQR